MFSVQKVIKSDQTCRRLRSGVGDCAGSVADYLGLEPALIAVVIGTLQSSGSGGRKCGSQMRLFAAAIAEATIFILGRCCVEYMVLAIEAPMAALNQSGTAKDTKTTGIHRPLPSISNQFQANRSNRDQPRPPCHHVAPCRNMPDHHHPP